jgi:hypothetical protein
MRLGLFIALSALVVPLTADDAGALYLRARAAVAASLAGLPDYTCAETIERLRRRPRGFKFEQRDTIRLEVALAGGKELFSRPGAGTFEERSLDEMVGGTIGNGDFAEHARNLFLADGALFRFEKRERLDGRPSLRFVFHVPLVRSTFALTTNQAQLALAYWGHTWHDPNTFELRRIEIVADDIPRGVPVRRIRKQLDYAPVEIGGVRHTLPSRCETRAVDSSRGVHLLRTTFGACRRYAGASTLILGGENTPPRNEK